MWPNLLVILLGYLLGSIPFAYLITRVLTGQDIRVEGEGNVGARNVWHTVGVVPGVLTALLDMGKGTAAYWLTQKWAVPSWAFYLTAAALMLGHGFPIWLRFRGGKGLAAAFGFLLPMWPWSVLGTAVVFLLARLFIPDFNLAFAVGGAAFPFLTLIEGNNGWGVLFICCFLGMAGIKKALDLPHERAIRARSGWVEKSSPRPEVTPPQEDLSTPAVERRRHVR